MRHLLKRLFGLVCGCGCFSTKHDVAGCSGLHLVGFKSKASERAASSGAGPVCVSCC